MRYMKNMLSVKLLVSKLSSTHVSVYLYFLNEYVSHFVVILSPVEEDYLFIYIDDSEFPEIFLMEKPTLSNP